MTDEQRRTLRTNIRTALTPYQGGRFTTGASGGASGVLYFTDKAGREFFIGGLNNGYAQHLTDALNAMLQLLQQ